MMGVFGDVGIDALLNKAREKKKERKKSKSNEIVNQ